MSCVAIASILAAPGARVALGWGEGLEIVGLRFARIHDFEQALVSSCHFARVTFDAASGRPVFDSVIRERVDVTPKGREEK